jgi:hypothetical protein
MLNGGSEYSPLHSEGELTIVWKEEVQLLRLDPIKRLTANDALDHPWFWTTPRPAKCAE